MTKIKITEFFAELLVANKDDLARSIKVLAENLQQLLEDPAIEELLKVEGYHELIDQTITSASSTSIDMLDLPEESAWWDRLINHPDGRVRKAVAGNRLLPARICSEIPLLSEESKKGYIWGEPQPEILKALTSSDQASSIRRLASIHLAFLEDADGQKTNFTFRNLGTKESGGKINQVATTLIEIMNSSLHRTAFTKRSYLIPVISVGTCVGFIIAGILLLERRPSAVVSQEKQPQVVIDYYTEAIGLANRALAAAKTAKGFADFNKTRYMWSAAASFMGKVSPGDRNYRSSIEKKKQYMDNAAHAENLRKGAGKK